MGKNTAWGNSAYRETRSNGGSKEEARSASSAASESYYSATRERQFGNTRSSEHDHSDFNSSVNGNGTHWHDSSDL